MKSSIKKLLACLAVFCTMGVIAACGETDAPVDTGSQPGQSTDTGSDTGSEQVTQYTVTFVDWNDTVLSTQTYEAGATVTAPANPTRAADNTYTYVFAGWDKEVSATATGNVTYKATYTETYIDYTITFLNEDDSVIETQTLHYGDAVTAPTAIKAADNTYTYTFAGWDKEVVAVAGNETYKATYTQAYIDYTITFLNEDDSVIETQTLHYGDAVTAPTAIKAADNTYTYTFAGWDKEVTAVAGNETYKATYTEAYIDYTVTFVDGEGKTVSTEVYHYGDTVNVPNAPAREASFLYTYEFASWDKEVVAVAGETTYTATYTATLKSGVTASQATAKGEGVVLAQSAIGGGANYTQGEQVDNEQNDDTPSFVKQSYLAFDGNYGVNTYIAFDFTGKNMPEVAFFAKNYNNSMYANGTFKQGIVVYTGITTWDGKDATLTQDRENGTYLNYGFPYMLQDAANGGFVRDSFRTSALGRANLVDGKQYRVVMGFEGKNSEGTNGITLHWYLYDVAAGTMVEQSSMETWNFFTGSNAQVGNMKVADLAGSIVLYGKFGVDCTIDKVWGVYENTTLANVADGINNNKSYTVSFQDANGNELQSETLAFGAMPVFKGTIPTPEKTEDLLFTYAYAWDKTIVATTSEAVYKLVLIASPKASVKSYKTSVQGDAIILEQSGIGNGANYTLGQNNGGYVDQSYLGLDGNYGLDNYVVFDFTGKNMPEIAFFAKNYNNSMYAEGTSKQGIVVYTGITTWDGKDATINQQKTPGSFINYGFPYMLQDAANGGFVQGAFADSALGRANLVDGKHYRVVMGFSGSGSAITLSWCLYDLDTKAVVEQSSMTTWNFFTGSNAQVGNMTINDLAGSIVFYGRFGTACTIDKLYNVESGAFADIVAKYTTNA